MTTLPAPLDLALVLDRRGRGRTSYENAATGLISAIVQTPQAAAAALVRDVEGGADPRAVVALLEAAADLARLRGLKLDPFVRAMRARLCPPVTPGAGARPPSGRSPRSTPQKGLRSWLRSWLSGPDSRRTSSAG